MRHSICLAGLIGSLVAAATAAGAQTSPDSSKMPASAFYIGVGASLGAADFGTQNIYAVGTSNVYAGNTLVATGTALGPPVGVKMSTEFALAPTIQAGYYAQFAESNWLWGVKFDYSYLNASSTAQRVLLPQYGSFTDQASKATTPFTGTAIVRSSQTTVVQQMSLIPTIGQSFGRGFVYAGAGLTLSQLRANQHQLVGFADINGNRQDVSGAPQDFNGSAWTFGGVATVGATYFFDTSWFVDLNYKYGMTGTQRFNYASSYSNSSTSNGTRNVGTLVGYASYRLISQSLSLTINRAF
jgi:hypothetical protein